MVILAAPPQGELPSGGFRFNRRVAEELSAGRFAVREVAARDLPRIPDRPALPGGASLTPNDTILVDSLFFHAPEAVEELRRRFRGALWMLIHYLPSLDPTLSAERAQALRRGEERCLRLCDGAAVTGRYTQDVLRQRESGPGRIVVAEPGVEEYFFRPSATRTAAFTSKEAAAWTSKEEAAWTSARTAGPLMMTVANWTPLKNHAALLGPLAELRELPWSWEMYGSCRPAPELCRSFREEAEQLGVAARIRRYGPKRPERIAARLGAAEVCLAPSLLESYGMSIAEAMAAGCAVVAADRGGSDRLISDGEDGLLCDPAEPQQWRRALERLLHSPAERQRLGAAARRKARRFPGWRDTAEMLLDGIEGEGAPEG